MGETATRLTPAKDTLRELFLKSGNICAFPDCTKLMMNAEGAFIGQICHIEAAEKGGERFNPAMTNEDRRSFENLMLMCYEHHVITDDVAKFPVETLRKFKAEHEARFASPDRAILATLKDWTTVEEPVAPRNLGRANKVLGWGNSAEELAGTAHLLGTYIEKLSRVPVEVRSFVGKVAERARRLGKSPAVGRSPNGLLVACSDIENAFKLSEDALVRQVTQLELYGLGRVDDLDIGGRDVPAVLVRDLDGWPFWSEVAQFCASESVPIATFTELLDFSSLDE
jgi:hypothetical protein